MLPSKSFNGDSDRKASGPRADTSGRDTSSPHQKKLNVTHQHQGNTLDWMTEADTSRNAHASRTGKSLTLWAVSVLWFTGVCGGMSVLWSYSSEPSHASTSAAGRWPEGSGVSRNESIPTLVVAIHPKCPCSRATAEELSRIVRYTQQRMEVIALVYSPDSMPQGWERTDLWSSLSKVTWCRVISDTNGAEIARFGAATSGECMLFGADGVLVFHGGITGSRGHAGDNAGSSSVVAYSRGHELQRSSTPVFGRSIFDAGASACCEENNP